MPTRIATPTRFSPIITSVVDSYPESNYTNLFNFGLSAGYRFMGQSFTNTETIMLDSCKFYLSRSNTTPTGNAYAELYNHVGDYGQPFPSGGHPSGAAIAISDPVDSSGIGITNSLVAFTFSSTNRIIITPNYYCIIVHFESTNDGYLKMGYDNTSSSHSGYRQSSFDGTTWYPTSQDIIFYVYGATQVPTHISTPTRIATPTHF